MASSDSSKHVKVLVLGSGPAGLSAALYAARAELAPVVITGIQLGGQAALTYTVENYPGFPDGVGGAELGELLQKQAERFGAKVEFDTANEVDLSGRPFKVITDNGNYLADTLVIATGASSNQLMIPGEKELTGRGVSYCATCDGWFFKDKKVTVVGGGDSALEEGLFITRYASSVSIIHRREELRASPLLQKRAIRASEDGFHLEHGADRGAGIRQGRGGAPQECQDGRGNIYLRLMAFSFSSAIPRTPKCSKASWIWISWAT